MNKELNSSTYGDIDISELKERIEKLEEQVSNSEISDEDLVKKIIKTIRKDSALKRELTDINGLQRTY